MAPYLQAPAPRHSSTSALSPANWQVRIHFVFYIFKQQMFQLKGQSHEIDQADFKIM